MKKHLLEGVKKGAFDEAEAEKRFQAWLTSKEAKIQAKKDSLKAATADEKKAKLKAEAKINESRLAEIAKKNAAAAAEALAPKEEEPAGETETTEENTEA